jgi:biopolymer transport protein ExbB
LGVRGIPFTFCAAITLSATSAAAWGQTGGEAEQRAPASFFEIVFSGGVPGFLIMTTLLLLSLTAVALAVEHSLTIRRKILMPEGLSERVRQLLGASRLAEAQAACKAQPSFLAFVLQAGMGEVDGGWSAVEKSMEDAAAEQSARLFRKIEYLSVIANLAPMIGLLGTVVGMVLAFQQVAVSRGEAQAAELAEGIYQALATTVAGLLVAIPSLAAFAVFRNRVDQFVAEAAYAAQHAAVPIKRIGRRRPTPPEPPVE